VAALLSAKFSVTILSRSESTTPPPVGTTVVKTDYTSVAALSEALRGHDAVVCALGVQGIPDQINVIDAAVAVGIKRVIPGEFGNAPEQKRLEELAFAWEPKKRVLDYAKEKALANADFTWTALATGNFIDYVGVFRPAHHRGVDALTGHA
jgi:uncharacterized protein YbjT (DUF2867 family)